MCLSLFSLFSPSAAMTSPSALRLLLIFCVSRRRSLSFPAPLALSRSLPARSTRFSAPSHTWPVCVLVPRMRSVKTECEREERSFISVAATVRREFAVASRERTCAGERSGWTTTSVTRVEPPFSCLISCFFLSNSPFPRRSLMVSLYYGLALRCCIYAHKMDHVRSQGTGLPGCIPNPCFSVLQSLGKLGLQRVVSCPRSPLSFMTASSVI